MGKTTILLSASLLFVTLSLSHVSEAKKKRSHEFVIVPAWKVQIDDEEGRPIKGALVRQTWKDYDVEEEGHEQDAHSNKEGYARFPERTIRTTSEARATGRAKNIRELGVHTSFGPDAHIFAWTDTLEGDIGYEVGKPLATKLVMRPTAVPKSADRVERILEPTKQARVELLKHRPGLPSTTGVQTHTGDQQ